ncbi:MAG: class I SAM-dependent methyltransferase [Bacteroidales bacterium]
MVTFNSWNERFASEDYYYGTEANLYLAEKIRKYHPGLLLLPGEGEGRNAVFAASLGCDVYAFDQSTVAREKALKLARSRNLRIDYRIAGIEDAGYPSGYFHMVGLIYLHLPEMVRKKAHQKFWEWLAPGGYLVLEAFHKSHWGNPMGPRDISMLYDENELQHDFSSMEITELYTTPIELAEGRGHRGKAVVVRLTAHKK